MFLHGLLPSDYETAVECFYPKLLELKHEGKIRFIGFSTRFKIDHTQESAKKALVSDPHLWDVIMLKYGIMNQHAEKEILPLASKHDVGIMNMAAVRVKLPWNRFCDNHCPGKIRQVGSLKIFSLFNLNFLLATF